MKLVQINYKLLNDLAVKPKRQTQYAFGYDVTAVSMEDITRKTFVDSIKNNSWIMRLWKTLKWKLTRHQRLIKYGTGLVLQPNVQDSTDNRAVIFAPRSSVYKTGLQLTNDIGIIDVDEYTGEITAVYREVDSNLPHYNIGDRVGQIFWLSTAKMDFKQNSIRETERGACGYGSTGNN